MVQMLHFVRSERGTCLHNFASSSAYQRYIDDTSIVKGARNQDDFFMYEYTRRYRNTENAPSLEEFKKQEGDALLHSSKVLGYVCRICDTDIPVLDPTLPAKNKYGKYNKVDLYTEFYTPRISTTPLLWKKISGTQDVFLTPAEFLLLTTRPPYNLRIPLALESLSVPTEEASPCCTVVISNFNQKLKNMTRYFSAYANLFAVPCVLCDDFDVSVSALKDKKPNIYAQIMQKTEKFTNVSTQKKGV